jgi:coatomer protein complex subunit epsilon
LEQAVEKDPKNAEGIANLLVLNAISGNNTDELTEYVTNILDCRMHC